MHEALLWERGRRSRALPAVPARVPDRRRTSGRLRRAREPGRQAGARSRTAQVSSIAVDPIEKKPVFHYHPGTTALSLGSVGCTMRCGHCQNWQISRAKPGERARDLHEVAPATVVDMAQEYGCLGVAFTYNEPVIWIEYVLDTREAVQGGGAVHRDGHERLHHAEGLDLIGAVHRRVARGREGLPTTTRTGTCARCRSVKPILEHGRAREEALADARRGRDERDADHQRRRGDAAWHRALDPRLARPGDARGTSRGSSRTSSSRTSRRRRSRRCGARVRSAGGGAATSSTSATSTSRAARTRRARGAAQPVVTRDGYRVVEQHLRDGACAHCGRPVGIVA